MMDYLFKLILRLVLVLSSFLLGVNSNDVFAQQVQQYGIWKEAIQLFNPALAGENGKTNFLLNYRSQWLGLEGNPSTTSFYASTALPGIQSGVGFFYFNDQLGNRDINNLGLQLSHMIIRKNDITWSVGVDFSYQSIGLNRNGVILPGGGDPGDDTALQAAFNSRNNILWGGGTHFRYKSLLLGMSGRQLVNFSEKSFNSYVAENEWFFNVSYSLRLNNSLELSPFSIFYSNFSVFQSFLAVEAVVNEQLIGALGVRVSDEMESIGATLGYLFGNGLTVKYQYEFGLNRISTSANGSHEILMAYEIDWSLGKLVPRPPIYSPRML